MHGVGLWEEIEVLENNPHMHNLYENWTQKGNFGLDLNLCCDLPAQGWPFIYLKCDRCYGQSFQNLKKNDMVPLFYVLGLYAG